MVAAAFVAAGAVMHRDFARKGEPTDLAWTMVAAAIVGGLIGARLNLAIEHPAAFAAAPLAFLTSRSGFVWYGGLLGGMTATLWPIRRAGVRWASAADTAAPALALGLAIGRIGCHLSGDGDWGVPSTLPWAVAYPDGIAPWPHPPGVRVHPAALYECAALLALFVGLWWARRRVERPGTVFALYLVAAGGIRFLVETVRTNRPVAFGWTEAQWMSVLAAFGAAIWLGVTRGGRRAGPSLRASR